MTSMSDRSQRPTLWDVARAAGVSAKTVSRVLNGEAGVAADTTARVQAAIAELGFERNEAARQLRTGRMARGRSLCLLVPELGDAGRAELAGSLASAVEAHGYRLLMTGSGSAGEREAELVQNLSEAGVAGFFVVSAAADHRYLIPHLRQGLAAAFLLHPAAQMQADSVLVDEVDAARQATQHLLRFSHRRIAFLGPRHDHLAGYQDALSGSGIPLDPDVVRTAVQEAPEAEAAAREWLAAPVPPTAIVVAGAWLALAAMRPLLGSGMGLVVLEDVPAADLLKMPLTTVSASLSDFGEKAAEVLVNRLEGRAGPPQRVVVRAHLVARGSGEVRPGLNRPGPEPRRSWYRRR